MFYRSIWFHDVHGIPQKLLLSAFDAIASMGGGTYESCTEMLLEAKYKGGDPKLVAGNEVCITYLLKGIKRRNILTALSAFGGSVSYVISEAVAFCWV